MLTFLKYFFGGSLIALNLLCSGTVLKWLIEDWPFFMAWQQEMIYAIGGLSAFFFLNFLMISSYMYESIKR